MIVSTLEEDEKKVKRKYPYIGKYDNIALIILFTSKGSGVVLYPTGCGECLKNLNESNFNLYNFPVTICNADL